MLKDIESHERLEKGIFLLFLIALASVAVSEVHSFDVFWQLQSGKYIWQEKTFIYKDIFSLASDVYRWEHCWLHDIVLYFFYVVAGYAGISVFKGMMIVGTTVLLAMAARVRGSSYLSMLWVMPPVILFSRGGWLERPQLWTFLLFAAFVYILERYRRHPDWRIFLLVPLMVLWVNVHAGALLAFPVMFAYLVGEGLPFIFKRTTLSAKAYMVMIGVAVLLVGASVVTPYGPQLLDVLIASPNVGGAGGAGGGQSAVPITQALNMDWRATTFRGDPYYFYVLGGAAVLVLAGFRKITLTDLCLLGGLSLMGLKLSRHTGFFFYASAAILPLYLDAALRWIPKPEDKVLRYLKLTALLAVCGSIFYFALPAYQVYGSFKTGLREWHYPIEAAEFVEEKNLPRNLFNTYDWGGYLMWKLFPEYKVFWDGRSDSQQMFRLGIDVINGNPGWEWILERYRINTIVSKACDVSTGKSYPLLHKLKTNQRWALVFSDDSSLVFVRRSAVDSLWLKQYEMPKKNIDKTILSEAMLLVTYDASRYNAWWEMARIFMDQNRYLEAYKSLEWYMKKSPAPHQKARYYYNLLRPRYEGRGNQ